MNADEDEDDGSSFTMFQKEELMMLSQGRWQHVFRSDLSNEHNLVITQDALVRLSNSSSLGVLKSTADPPFNRAKARRKLKVDFINCAAEGLLETQRFANRIMKTVRDSETTVDYKESDNESIVQTLRLLSDTGTRGTLRQNLMGGFVHQTAAQFVVPMHLIAEPILISTNINWGVLHGQPSATNMGDTVRALSTLPFCGYCDVVTQTAFFMWVSPKAAWNTDKTKTQKQIKAALLDHLETRHEQEHCPKGPL